jgi:hypothetical protein
MAISEEAAQSGQAWRPLAILMAMKHGSGLYCKLMLTDVNSMIKRMIKDVSRISLVCSLAIFQARNDPVWFSPRLVT